MSFIEGSAQMLQFVRGAVTTTMTQVSLGWLVTRSDADSGITSSFLCMGDLLTARSLFSGSPLVRLTDSLRGG